MNKKAIPSISIVGAGNVASHLGAAMLHAGMPIMQVWSREATHGRQLAHKLKAEFVREAGQIDPGVDLIIISVPDEAIHDIISRMKKCPSLVVHTSGAQTPELLSMISSRTGVFYPLQTFRKGIRMNFREVPICIEASNEQDRDLLFSIAQKISTNVVFMDSSDRLILHLAAVFASNFSNFMYCIAEEMLKEHQISFDLLRPLILKTASNARKKDLFRLQTGPAVRGDVNAIASHLRLLQHNPEYKGLYELITHLIVQNKKRNGKL